MIKIGNNEITDLKIGDTSIKAYLGDTLVFGEDEPVEEWHDWIVGVTDCSQGFSSLRFSNVSDEEGFKAFWEFHSTSLYDTPCGGATIVNRITSDSFVKDGSTFVFVVDAYGYLPRGGVAYLSELVDDMPEIRIEYFG